MVEDTEEEKFFRERYADELRKKKARSLVSWPNGYDDLSDERNKVKQQQLRTPGRRGEEIKLEEIDKEVIRRLKLKHQSQQK